MQSGLQIVEIQLRSMISKDCFDVLVALANNKESASNVSTECNQLTLSLFPIFSTARRLTSLQHKHTSVYPTVFGIIRKNTIRIDSNYFTLLVMANATPSVLQNLKTVRTDFHSSVNCDYLLHSPKHLNASSPHVLHDSNQN